MVLCSCLSGAANRVQQDFDVQNDYLGAHGYSRRITNERGVQLFSYFWPANEDVPLRGVVQLLHGNSTYIGFDFLRFQGNGLPNLYEGSWVQELNRRGFSVCGIDHEGCGRSPGVRSYVRSFDIHVDNAMLFARHVRQCEDAGFPAGAPHFLMGYSLGGLVSVMVALRQPAWFAGMVLISPMISLERRARETKHLRPLLKLLSALAPRLPVGASTTELPVPWIQQAWDADPLIYNGGMRARNAEEYFRASETVMSEWAGADEKTEEDGAATSRGSGGGDGGGEGAAGNRDAAPPAAEAQPSETAQSAEERERKQERQGEAGGGEKAVSAKRGKRGGRRRGAAPAAAARGGLRLDCVSVPLLVFQGDRDTLVEPAGAEALVRRAATHEKRLRVVPGAWHVLVKEEGNEALLEEALQWLEEQCRTSRTLGLFRLGGGSAAAATGAALLAWASAGSAGAAPGVKGGGGGGGSCKADGWLVDSASSREGHEVDPGEGESPSGGLIQAARSASAAESSVGSNTAGGGSGLPGAVAAAGAVGELGFDPSPSHKSYHTARSGSSRSSSASAAPSSPRSSVPGGRPHTGPPADEGSPPASPARSSRSSSPSLPAASRHARASASASASASAASSGRRYGPQPSAESVEGRLEYGAGEERRTGEDGRGSRAASRASLNSSGRSTMSRTRRYGGDGPAGDDGASTSGPPPQPWPQHPTHHLPDFGAAEEGGGSGRSGQRADYWGTLPPPTPEPDNVGQRSSEGSPGNLGERRGRDASQGLGALAQERSGREEEEEEEGEEQGPLGAPGRHQQEAEARMWREEPHAAGRAHAHASGSSPDSPAGAEADAAGEGDSDAESHDNSADGQADPPGPLLRPLPPLPPVASSGVAGGYSRYAPLPPIHLGSHAG